MKKNVLAIIPARDGSKRVPKKNLKKLSGKPLIAWSIEQAKKSKYIDKVVVSTDSDEIAKTSKIFGAEIIKRPKKLAEDKTPTTPVIMHAINKLEKQGYQTDIVVLLQPTSPLRETSDIDKSMRLYLDNKCESVVSVKQEKPFWTFKIRGKLAKPLFSWKYFKMRSQDLPKTYALNGSIYITSTKSLEKYNGFFNKKMVLFEMPQRKSIDIDEEIDFLIAEKLMKK